MSAAEGSAPDSLLFDTAGMPAGAAFERYRDLYGIGAEAIRLGPDFRTGWRRGGSTGCCSTTAA